MPSLVDIYYLPGRDKNFKNSISRLDITFYFHFSECKIMSADVVFARWLLVEAVMPRAEAGQGRQQLTGSIDFIQTTSTTLWRDFTHFYTITLFYTAAQCFVTITTAMKQHRVQFKNEPQVKERNW